jgi:hypothetical protein
MIRFLDRLAALPFIWPALKASQGPTIEQAPHDGLASLLSGGDP